MRRTNSIDRAERQWPSPDAGWCEAPSAWYWRRNGDEPFLPGHPGIGAMFLVGDGSASKIEFNHFFGSIYPTDEYRQLRDPEFQ